VERQIQHEVETQRTQSFASAPCFIPSLLEHQRSPEMVKIKPGKHARFKPSTHPTIKSDEHAPIQPLFGWTSTPPQDNHASLWDTAPRSLHNTLSHSAHFHAHDNAYSCATVYTSPFSSSDSSSNGASPAVSLISSLSDLTRQTVCCRARHVHSLKRASGHTDPACRELVDYGSAYSARAELFSVAPPCPAASHLQYDCSFQPAPEMSQRVGALPSEATKNESPDEWTALIETIWGSEDSSTSGVYESWMTEILKTDDACTSTTCRE
jgi:hypothetical protein